MQVPDIHEPQMDLVVTYALLPTLVGKILVEYTSVIIEIIARFYRPGSLS